MISFIIGVVSVLVWVFDFENFLIYIYSVIYSFGVVKSFGVLCCFLCYKSGGKGKSDC